jgi:hypothetical protein
LQPRTSITAPLPNSAAAHLKPRKTKHAIAAALLADAPPAVRVHQAAEIFHRVEPTAAAASVPKALLPA